MYSNRIRQFCGVTVRMHLVPAAEPSESSSLPGHVIARARRYPHNWDYLRTNATVDIRVQELCESRGGRPELPSLISLRFLWT